MKLLCIRDVAKETGRNRHTIAGWFASGKLRTMRPHGMKRDYTTPEWLKEYQEAESRPNSGPIALDTTLQTQPKRATSKRVKRSPSPHQNQWRKEFR